VSHILDVNIFAYDYTGYGMSSGEPSEEALYADIEAAFKYLRDIVGIPWSGLAHLGFWGCSRAHKSIKPWLKPITIHKSMGNSGH